MKKIIFALLTILFPMVMLGQNYIGYNKYDIITGLKKKYPGWRIDATQANKENGSIKCLDPNEDVTLIYFLTAQGECKFSKFLIDNSRLKHTVDTLVQKYPKVEELKWATKSKGIPCIITVEKSDWYSTVFITKKK